MRMMIEVEQEEDGRWIAEVVDLLGTELDDVFAAPV